ncbi:MULTISPECIES: nuclear transport factor 2 family protein [unclassified Cupriavidus]|uniref:nuclear transport factor 2 family protein n=1 Tax=unclassified Cupriavidus TaxID=2640874 RepID=UPI001C00689C|nr:MULTISPECIES: nuclear transport factor 2 family protein [unclassified Cupriavidus]MCA3186013.1 nuclear transport factor 2 family protein [Cupriavidus sp.]MCA3192441.1 nuclear transport factor 2 family protein [Cupriavidus sp.]MCA3198947.1 nuclear transport factor 2 family protein [Cupriavidus sp.]MCA3205309.1 nuclear transport factor 2 family protein [Cupriavidus sp.]MCA3207257.1 nuclear transport factor 2 family protein [Cupriavidus sp.]
MRKFTAALGAAILLGFAATPVLAQSADTRADTQAVTAAAEKLRVAMVDPDQATLSGLVGDSLSYGHSGGRIDTKTSFIGDLLDKKSDFVSISITDQSVHVSGDVAVVRHTLSGETLDGGKQGTVLLKVLQVWQKQGGHWKLIARQAVKAA